MNNFEKLQEDLMERDFTKEIDGKTKQLLVWIDKVRADVKKDEFGSIAYYLNQADKLNFEILRLKARAKKENDGK